MTIFAAAGLVPAGRDGDHGQIVTDGSQPGDQFAAWQARDLGIHHDSVDIGKAMQHLDGLVGAVRRDDVEHGGLNHELASGDAAGILLIHDKKTGSDHSWWDAVGVAADSRGLDGGRRRYRESLDGGAVSTQFFLLKRNGGEGGIRTPDSLSTMPDFESEYRRIAQRCTMSQAIANNQ